MEASSQIYQILIEIVTQLPSMLTMLGGSIVAIIRWKRHPRVSLMVVISLFLTILHTVVFVLVFAAVRSRASYENYEMLRTYQTLVSIAYNFILAILTAILLTAVFMQRNKSPEQPAPERLAHAA